MADLQSVLVIDDDEDMRDLAEVALAQLGGLEVRLAETPERALAMLAEELPDLVLCDVVMPRVSGPQLLQTIRERFQVPVVFLTARAGVAEAESYRAQGALGVVAKPFDPMTLAREVRRVYAER